MRFGTVTLIGRTNVGKSTFLNWALGERLAITSPLPQTTRDALLGVVTRPEAQIAFLDTPGLHRPRTELGRRMNVSAYDSLLTADVIVMITDAGAPARTTPGTEPNLMRPGDHEILDELRKHERARRILLVNKVDTVKNKPQLLPMLEAYSNTGLFETLVPMSCTRQTNLEQALTEIANRLPEAPAAYEPDTLTNRPTLYFVREYVREAILNQLGREVPHAVAISIDEAIEQPEILRVQATIHVEKLGQRKIVVGQGGSRIKEIGIAARLRLEQLLEKKVHLELYVRISPAWKDTPRKLNELGYEESHGTSGKDNP
jgi:GTPase